MDHTYDLGWHKYGFDSMDFEDKAIHGSTVPLSLRLAINRGLGKPHITFATIPVTEDAQAIGMHAHLDLPTGNQVEEWYIIIDGSGVMTFSNGDSVDVGPGDMVATYPGTGHSFRASSTVRLISITPEMFTSDEAYEPFPDDIHPRILVSEVTQDSALNIVAAECAACGASWTRSPGDAGSSSLASWAHSHLAHCETTRAE